MEPRRYPGGQSPADRGPRSSPEHAGASWGPSETGLSLFKHRPSLVVAGLTLRGAACGDLCLSLGSRFELGPTRHAPLGYVSEAPALGFLGGKENPALEG